jgi:hypothetical protein
LAFGKVNIVWSFKSEYITEPAPKMNMVGCILPEVKVNINLPSAPNKLDVV